MLTPLRLTALLSMGLGAVGCSRAAASVPPPAQLDGGSSGFALVELFTSEGCSSCPRADQVLVDLADAEERTPRRVFTLAFHVDYWNDLGWADPFSSALATNRQHAYAQVLGEHGVYTPEMVINGREAFVGSDRQQARRSIEAALAHEPAIDITLRPTVMGNQISLDYTFSHEPPKEAVLQLALVAIAATSQVTAGENAGRTLRHAHVVKAFQTVSHLGGPGHATFSVPPGLARNQLAVIAYLQDDQTMAIAAATMAKL